VYIVFKGCVVSHHLAAELFMLTGRSYLLPRSIAQDKANKKITFLIQRAVLIGVNRKLFGTIDIPIYDGKANGVISKVTIGSVISTALRTRGNELPERVQILEGLILRPGEICVTSVEEDKGEPFLELEIRIEDLDFVLEDVDMPPAC
jgi:hypothetical protein